MKKNDVKNFIKGKIESRKWTSGTKIYSEYQLQNALNVSRGTVRSAINELNIEGYLETIKGSGTFVKNDINNDKKYILILTNNDIINISNNTFRLTVELLKKEIINKNYLPLCYTNNFFTIQDSLSNLIDNIGGIITLYPYTKEKKYFQNKNIPIVNAINSVASSEPTIIIDYESFFQKLREIINKYNFKDIMIFGQKMTTDVKNIKEKVIFLFMESYFQKYNYYAVDIFKEKNINKILNNVQKSPDCIIFLDEHIYEVTKYQFTSNEIFKNTKIITQSSILNTDPITNTCKFTFDNNQVAKEAVNLLIKLMENKPIKEYNIYIQPIIENEEALKKSGI